MKDFKLLMEDIMNIVSSFALQTAGPVCTQNYF